ncbi:MAG: DUF4823 domain-containing protein [Methylococcaceae bacterium]|jgi:hypothetical protein|nr:DUF4823 domain-containing protein [Methylococcaceae bacterium]
MRFTALLIAILITAGCASEGTTFTRSVLNDPKSHLTRGKPVYIATPKNGWYENTEYPGSGRMTAANVRAAFARFSDHVVVSEQCQDLSCLKRTHTGSSNSYYVVPEILRWEGRNKNWSQQPDVIEIKISVFEADSSKSRASAILSGKNRNPLFSTDHPQETLQDPVSRYVSSLY